MRNKHSIYLDEASALLAANLMGKDATMSAFVQRLIKEEGERKGLRVELKLIRSER